MADLPRNLPHFHLHDVGQSEPYTSRQRPQTPPPPARSRGAHAQALLAALNHALVGANAQVAARADAADAGFYLQFELPPGNEEFVHKLEDRRSHIELMSVKRGPDENAPAIATVFVPHRAANYFLNKVTAYQNEVTKRGRPKNENLVNRIDTVSLAVIRPFFTDEEDRLPADNQPIWWEIWLRLDLRPQSTKPCFLCRELRNIGRMSRSKLSAIDNPPLRESRSCRAESAVSNPAHSVRSECRIVR